jgi:regulation of enolase protein 1 (concanavalin A-like superfamily)
VKRGTAAAGPFTTVASNVATTSYVDQTVMNGMSYAYVVAGVNAAGEGAASTAVTASPSPWSQQDVGATGVAGSMMLSAGTFTIAGAGPDIYGTADAFHYVFQNVSGDATLIARVVSIENKDVWSKAGIMMRDGLAPGAANVAVITSPTATNDYRLQTRTTAGGTTSTDKATAGKNPVWFRLVRKGNTFTGSFSADGKTWTTIGAAQTVTMPAAITVGLVVCSHATVTANGVFDSVTLTTP